MNLTVNKFIFLHLRYRPDIQKCKIQKKVSEPNHVKHASEIVIIEETAEEWESDQIEKCKATRKGNKNYAGDSFEEDKEMLQILSYNQMVFDYYPKNPFKLPDVRYRVSEDLPEYWGQEDDIPEVVYEHALLQNVEFEWGTWGRGVRLENPVKTCLETTGWTG